MTKQYFLGVDIGATKSHALVADTAGRAIGFGQAGPGNHEVVGYPGLIAVLEEITSAALAAAGIKRQGIAGAGFGIAGYDWPSERADTLAAIATLGLDAAVEAVNDTLIGLLAGSEAGWGVAVVAGTGSNCWGINRQGRIAHLTGCGEAFAEYGGGGDIVAAAVRAVAKAWSRRGPETALTALLSKRAGVTTAEALLEGLSQGTLSVGAESAPLVFQAAEAGDLVADGIIRWIGCELGEMALGIIRQLDLSGEKFEIVLVGSVYNGGERLLAPMRETIRAEALGARLVRLTAPPVAGAVLLGMQQAGLAAPALRPALIASTRELLAERVTVRPITPE